MKIGDSIKVKDQEIYGKIIYDYGNAVVIEDEHAETEDDKLYFKKNEIKLNKGGQMSSEKQWVECLKCDKQFEQPKNDEVCIYCNNQDRQETIYLSEEMVNDE